jgi:hypothetical protein
MALSASWITRELADEAMLRRVDEQQGRDVVGQKGKRDCAGVLFPYYWPGQPAPRGYRLRRDHPEWVQGKDGQLKPNRKYLGAPGEGNRLYIPPGVTTDQLNDPTIPIAIVEGEKKALALWRLANYEAQKPRFIPIAIPGVWNWKGIIGKTTGPNGERLDVHGPIADLGRINWTMRKAFVVFDTNVHSNNSVKWARNGLARELATRNADVHLVNLPENCGLNGIDDALAAWGPDRMLEFFAAAAPANQRTVRPPQFVSHPEGMFRISTRGDQYTEIQLTNYRATIDEHVVLDDGLNTENEFRIEAELENRRYRFTVPANEFPRMDWPITKMGPRAITYARQEAYARIAIQTMSAGVAEQRIYTHTGWRDIDGRHCYLHAGGAIGEAGAVAGVHVRMAGNLARYELRLSANPQALAAAVRSSLDLVALGPPGISFPLLATVYRALFGDADFAVHLSGETGAFKSELAALHQQHFGAGMDRTNLPGSWASTGNALEALAFHAKDSLLVIDDFAPQGSATEVARYHAAADRVFRAAGNRAGRIRLDSTAKLREPKPPRALILSTGEDVPRGHSIRARLLILEIAKGVINPDTLSSRQRQARSGSYSEAIAGFLQWIARDYDALRAKLARRVSECRAGASVSAAHARTPEIVANLQAGFELFLEFAKGSGAINQTTQDYLADRCWDALREAAAAQGKYHTASEPTAQFLDILSSLLVAGRAFLEARDGGPPERARGSCGWRQENDRWLPHGDRIGWVDSESIYLDSKAAYRQVQMVGRDCGEILPITEQILKKRLREKNLLASTDESRGTLTIRKRIQGSNKDVLHFHRSTLFPEEPEDTDMGE